jgi:hypothetical protein
MLIFLRRSSGNPLQMLRHPLGTIHRPPRIVPHRFPKSRSLEHKLMYRVLPIQCDIIMSYCNPQALVLPRAFGVTSAKVVRDFSCPQVLKEELRQAEWFVIQSMLVGVQIFAQSLQLHTKSGKGLDQSRAHIMRLGPHSSHYYFGVRG